MKVIHWSPKKNKNLILEKGIKISDTWISCSVLTPFKNLNRWWFDFSLNEQECLGFIFELEQYDFPLVHSHWAIDTHTEYDNDYEIVSKSRNNLDIILKDNSNSVFSNIINLKNGYRKNIVWRIGNTIDESNYLGKDGIYKSDDEKIIASGIKLIKRNPQKAITDFFDNTNFMEFVFEDYEILLFKDVKPERIEKIIKPNSNYKYDELMNELKNEYQSNLI